MKDGTSAPGFDAHESPLARLQARKGRDGATFLTEAEMMAGERLRIDFTRAGLTPSVTQCWDPVPREHRSGRGSGELSDCAMDAKARVNAAILAIGPELSGVLLDVCCFLKGFETVERERQWPARSAKLLLKAGLGILARHYGYIAEPVTATPPRLRQWGTADYRPTISARKP